MRKFFLLQLLGLLIVSCKTEKSPSETHDLLITNVHIIDVEKAEILENSFIAISNDTIRATGKMDNIEEYKSEDTLDAQDNYAMPGLWDMHVHFRGGDTLISENKNLLPLFLAYGVTTVRDAGGDITPAVLEWRNKIAEGAMDGPEIFTSGPKLDGKNPVWEGSLKIEDQEDIKRTLDSLKVLKVDYIKMYDGSLSAENFYAIINEAEERNLKTTGHMPLKADFVAAIEHGLDGIEHMYYTVKASSILADSLSKTDLGYGMMEPLIDSYDPEIAQEVFNKMSSENVSITPTLHIGKTLANLLETDHSQDSLLQYIGKGIQKTYQRRIESAKKAKASGSKMREKMENLSVSMIVPMYEAGVNILAGSDSGAFNSFVYSGESLHSELEELVNAGLNPAQALETSIINGPEFFGLEDSFGSLKKGKVADLLILKGNPLRNIKNTQHIKFIIKNMKVYTPGELLKKESQQ